MTSTGYLDLDGDDGLDEAQAKTEGELPPTYGDTDGPGTWLTDPQEPEVAKQMRKAWEDQDTLWAQHRAECRANRYQRDGRANVQVRKVDGQQQYEVWAWGRAVPHLNLAAKLCRKLVAFHYADPPAPDVLPDELNHVDRDRADFARRILENLNDPTNLDGIALTRAALDVASTDRSAFIWTYVHPQGQRAPVTIDAHPHAMTAEAPLTGPAPTDPMGQPIPHPITGEPLPGADLPADEATPRFVQPHGALTDTQGEAAWQWRPRLKEELLTSLQVRPMPAMAATLTDAEGVLIARLVPLGQLKAQFPETVGQMTPAELESLKNKPGRAADYLLAHLGLAEQKRLLGLTGDDAVIFVLTATVRACPNYPQGFSGTMAGADTLLDRRAWVHPSTGAPLLINLSQWRQFAEGERNFYGKAAMDILRPMQDVVHGLVSYELDTADRNANKKVFLPHGTLINADDYANPEQPILYFNPGGQPWQENDLALDPVVESLLERFTEEMQEAIGLSDVAQGLDSSNVTSGRQAFAVIGQAQAALSELHQGCARAEERRWRIQLEQVSAFYSGSDQLQFRGPDGQYQVERWEGADVEGVQSVKTRAGSLSLLSPQAKLERAMSLAALPAAGITPKVLHDLLADGIGVEVGLREDPVRLEIRRQIAAWEAGPPAGWAPLPPQQVPGIAPGPDGQPMPVVQTVPTPDPVADGVFPQLPHHQMPQIAAMRAEELVIVMAGAEFTQAGPWCGVLVAEFQRCLTAMQPPAPPMAGNAPQGGSEDQKAKQQTTAAVTQAQGPAT